MFVDGTRLQRNTALTLLDVEFNFPSHQRDPRKANDENESNSWVIANRIASRTFKAQRPALVMKDPF